MIRVGESQIQHRRLLEVDGLTKRYGTHLAVDSLSFDVMEGEIVALLGPNGSGKSSTLHCISGILPSSEGHVQICGLGQDDSRTKMLMGFVPDDLALPLSLTGAEFLSFVARLQPTTDFDWRDFLVSELGLDHALHRFLAEYSHGMKRKIQLVAALAHLPKFLILDEPYRGLDPEASVILRELVREFVHQNGSTLVATHDLLMAETYFDRVYIMANGVVMASGAPRELREGHGKKTLEEVFLSVIGLEEPTREARRRVATRWPGNGKAESTNSSALDKAYSRETATTNSLRAW